MSKSRHLLHRTLKGPIRQTQQYPPTPQSSTPNDSLPIYPISQNNLHQTIQQPPTRTPLPPQKNNTPIPSLPPRQPAPQPSLSTTSPKPTNPFRTPLQLPQSHLPPSAHPPLPPPLSDIGKRTKRPQISPSLSPSPLHQPAPPPFYSKMCFYHVSE